MSGQRSIEGHCIEARRDHFKQLEGRLAAEDGWQAIHGTAVDQLPKVLARTDGVPCFVFLDPFGIKDMPFDLLTSVLRRGPKTEALVRFDNAGVWRTGGHLTSDHASPHSLEALDAFCGGDWWHDLWQPGEGRAFSDAVLAEYAARLGRGTGVGYFWFEVADSPDGPIAYHLIHFATHPLAFWRMNDELSKWRERAIPADNLFEQPDVWVDEIASNISALVTTRGPFKIMNQLGPVLGTTLGKARGLHVRKALQALEKEELVEGPVKGDIGRFVVSPRGRG
jgi:three-Cys-motif partner protein